MRANTENQSIDVEVRDINYIMGAYIMSYLYLSKNQDPEKIIVPMPTSVPHPRKAGATIPIEWIAPDSQYAKEVEEDSKDIHEVTPEEEATLDAEDKAAEEAKSATGPGVTEEQHDDGLSDKDRKSIEQSSETKEPATDRVPKMPASGDIGPGTHPDGMGSRDPRADKRIASDLKEEPPVDEEKEIPTEIEKPKE